MANWNTNPDWVSLTEINKGIEITSATGFLASDQNKIIENLQFLYNHLAAQHVYVGNISTVTGEEKTDANVTITSRSVQDLNNDDIEIYLDFVFTIPRGTSAKFGTPVASAHALDANSDPTVTVTATGDDEHKVFDFDFGIPRGQDVSLSDTYGTSTSNGYSQNYINGFNEKNLYNDGYYDSELTRDNYSRTVQRQTGYYCIDHVDTGGGTTSGGLHWYEDSTMPYLSTEIYTTSSGYIGATFVSNIFVQTIGDWAWYEKVECISSIQKTRNQFKFRIYLTAEDIASANKYLAEHPIYIQYKLPTSYTEKVRINQPINTLNADLQLRLRNECEKGLNLLNTNGWSYMNASGISFSPNYVDGKLLYVNIYGTATTTVVYEKKVTLTKGVYVLSNILGVGCSWANGDIRINVGSNTYDSETPFYVEETTECRARIYVYSGATVAQYLYPMLVRGTIPYPYQPYNGKIIHEVDLPVTSVNGKTGAVITTSSSYNTSTTDGYSQSYVNSQVSSLSGRIPTITYNGTETYKLKLTVDGTTLIVETT
jgi:hypothetical protein